MSDLWLHFAHRVRERRQEKGLSQDALAEIAGIHRTHVSLIERGLRCPSLAIADALASALDIPLSELIAEAEGLQRTRHRAKSGGA